jgi:hypothetical protein
LNFKNIFSKNTRIPNFTKIRPANAELFHADGHTDTTKLIVTFHNYLISHRYFRVKQEDRYSGLKPIKAGVPQGSVLGPVLYLLYMSDLPQPEGTTVATFANDTALMALGGDVAEATAKLQGAADEISNWSRQ